MASSKVKKAKPKAKKIIEKSNPRNLNMVGSGRLQDSYPDLLPISTMWDNGIQLETRGGMFVETRSKLNKEDGLRHCELEISDMLYSWNAQHYYAKIKGGYDHDKIVVGGVMEDDYTEYPEPGNWKKFIKRPYRIGDEWQGLLKDESSWVEPKQLWIEIQHLITAKDRRQVEERYLIDDKWTHGYWTPREAMYDGVLFFCEHFAPGWQLFIQYDYNASRSDRDTPTAEFKFRTPMKFSDALKELESKLGKKIQPWEQEQPR